MDIKLLHVHGSKFTCLGLFKCVSHTSHFESHEVQCVKLIPQLQFLIGSIPLLDMMGLNLLGEFNVIFRC